MVRVLSSVEEIESLVGIDLEPGEWLEIGQDRIDTFADATDDHQWIHCDPERAAAGPYGTTIAHGYLTASLLPVLLRTVLRFEGTRMSVNYGSDRMRFPAPVPVDSRIRARALVESVEAGTNGTHVGMRTTVERAGSDRPALVATTRSLVIF